MKCEKCNSDLETSRKLDKFLGRKVEVIEWYCCGVLCATYNLVG